MAHPYLQQLLHSAEQARQEGSACEQHIQVADALVTLHFATPALEEKLFPALAHQATTRGNKASLTIHVWDSSGGVELPAPESGSARSLMEQGERWGVNLRAGDPSSPRLYYMPPPNEYLCALDPAAKVAVYWFPQASRLPYYERGSPLRTVFDWWLESRGLLLTHAAAVGFEERGALIVGKGGRGKSTSAIVSMLASGLDYVADDYLALQPGDTPTAHSIYSTGKLDADHLQARLPQLLPMLDNPASFREEKGLFFFHRHHPERIVPRLPLRVALLPDVYDGAQARAVPAEPQRLLLGLAASTIYQSTGNGGLALNILRDSLLALPCYRLEIGTDLDSIGPCIVKLLREHRHA